MKLNVLAVGHRQPDWVSAGCAEYLKRMPRELPAAVTEIKPEMRGSKTREQLLAAERGRIRDALPAAVVVSGVEVAGPLRRGDAIGFAQ